MPAISGVQRTVSRDGALVVNSHNPVDASGGVRVVALPAATDDVSTLTVEKIDSSPNAVVVVGNIRGAVVTFSLSLQHEVVQFISRGSDESWWPIGDHKPLVLLATRAAIPAPASPAAGVIGTLKRGIRSCSLAIGGGDSTADDTLLEWFGLLGQKLQALYPAYTLRGRDWSNANQDFGMPYDIVAGTGNGGGERATASVGGQVFFQPLTVPGIAGDVDIRVKLLPVTWNPGASASEWLVAKYDGADPNGRSVNLGLISGKFLQFKWSVDGTAGTAVSKSSTAAVPFADGTAGWVRVVHDVDNGAAGNDVKFYTSTDGVNWTQLGTTVTTAGTTSHALSPNIPWRYNDNTQGTAAATTRNTYWVEIRNGIAGPLITPPLIEDWDTLANVTVVGAPVLLLQNGSFAGQSTTYFDDPTRRVLLNQPCNQRLVFLNTNTNEQPNGRAAFQATYRTWIGHVQGLVPNVPVVPVTQMRVYVGSQVTTQVGIDQREARADAIMSLANQAAGVFPIDTMVVWPTGPTQTLLTKTDGLHPSSFADTVAGGGTYPNGTYTGSQLIADTLYNQLFAAFV